MSIDARVSRVTREPDGTAVLHLVSRDGKSSPGQTQLTVLNPVPGLEFMEGECIWGGSGFLMYQNTVWADRIGYTTVRLRKAVK